MSLLAAVHIPYHLHSLPASHDWGKGKIGAKQDAKGTKPQRQLGGASVLALATIAGRWQLNFLHALGAAEAMTTSQFTLVRGSWVVEGKKLLVFRRNW